MLPSSSSIANMSPSTTDARKTTSQQPIPKSPAISTANYASPLARFMPQQSSGVAKNSQKSNNDRQRLLARARVSFTTTDAEYLSYEEGILNGCWLVFSSIQY